MDSKKDFDLPRKVYEKAGSLVRAFQYLTSPKVALKKERRPSIKVAFIHNEKRLLTGAHQINDLMSRALSEKGVRIRNFYPKVQLTDAPTRMRGLTNILFFHSLLERKEEILRYDIIQGTTYTPLPFLSFGVPIISHFGSTTIGFLRKTPKTSALLEEEKVIYRELKNLDIIPDLELETYRPIKDIADMEELVAARVRMCVATSEYVKQELMSLGVKEGNIRVIHNAIEDYWFAPQSIRPISTPHLVFIGRLGGDVFTLKLKGLARLIRLYRAFPDVPKTTICMTNNKKLKAWLRVAFPKHYLHTNIAKHTIPEALSYRYGSILFISSRYEGFSLSLVEGMSQGLVPVTFSVGVAPEIIINGENGYLVNSHEEAVEKVRELLTDNEKRLKMAEEARQTAERFQSKTLAEKLISLYQEIR